MENRLTALQRLNLLTFSTIEKAHVAELVDAADSKSAIRKGVKVRFLSWALVKTAETQYIPGFQPFFLIQHLPFN